MSAYGGSLTDVANQQQDYVHAMLATLLRRWPSLLLGTFLLFVGLAVGIQFLPKTFRGVAEVEVLSKTPNVASGNIVTADTQFTEETAGTEIEILKSYDLQKQVVEALGLVNNPEFNPDLHPGLVQRTVTMLRNVPLIEQYVPTDWWPTYPAPTPARMLYDTIQTLSKKVSSEPVSHSKIIQVTVSTHNPALAAEVVNEMVKVYVESHQDQKEAVYRQAHAFASQRVPKLREDMLEKNQRVADFQAAHNMVNGQYASDVKENLTTASHNYVDAMAKLQALKADVIEAQRSNPLSNPAVLASQTIAKLRELQAGVAAQAAAMPQREAVWRAQIEAFDTQIGQEAKRIVASLPNQVAVQAQVVETARAAVAYWQKEVSNNTMLQTQLDTLQRDANVATQQYTEFLNNDSHSSADVAFTAPDVRALSQSPVPLKPHFPNNMLMLPAALVLSFLINSTVILYRNRKVGFVSGKDFAMAFRVEPIGKIPYRTERTKHMFMDAIIRLGMRLVSPSDKTDEADPFYYEGKPQTILVTSSQPNEGKTTISKALAAMLAESGRKVVLVDADMRLSRSSYRTSKDVEPLGLRDVLAGLTDLPRAMTTAEKGLSILPAGKTKTSHPSALLASKQMPRLLDDLKINHDVIIIDAPPAPVGADSWALARMADRVLFIVKQGQTNELEVEDALGALAISLDKVNVVLNMVRIDADPTFSSRLVGYYSAGARH